MDDPADDPALLAVYLSSRDVPCPQCGYNLRQLTGVNCPECGEALALRVQSADPKQAAPIAGLIALSAGAGLNVLLLAYAIIVVNFRAMPLREIVKFIGVNGVGALVLGSCTFVWVRSWRRIRRLPAHNRWAWVAGCAIL